MLLLNSEIARWHATAVDWAMKRLAITKKGWRVRENPHDAGMEPTWADAAWAWLGRELVDLGFRSVVLVIATAMLSVFGTLLWGRGGRQRLIDSNRRLEKGSKRLKSRIAALEAKIEHVTVAEGPSEKDDDPFRRAEARWLHQPGVGREAARLIMMAPTFHEAQAVHDTFKAAERRLDPSWAHYAFLYRMEMGGRSDEVMASASEISEELGDEFIVDDEDEYWKELVSLYLDTRRRDQAD